MKTIKGNKTVEITKKELTDLVNQYKTVVVDLGTGDGRFTYKSAKENPNCLVLGIDPSQKQLELYSKRVNKEKFENALFVLGSVEKLPQELTEIANIVYIYFPWGSLLGGIARADEKIINNIASLVKPNGKLEIIFGYSQNAEPSESRRLGLDKLDYEKIQTEIIPIFERCGLKLNQLVNLEKEELLKIHSSWGKRLIFGQERKIFKLVLTKKA